MKVRFYCDIYPHSATGLVGGVVSLFAMSAPQSGPTSGAVRVAFDVEIPERILPSPVVVPSSPALVSEAGFDMAEYVSGGEATP